MSEGHMTVEQRIDTLVGAVESLNARLSETNARVRRLEIAVSPPIPRTPDLTPIVPGGPSALGGN